MSKLTRSSFVRISAFLLVLLAAGCSTFNRDWKSAAAATPPAPGGIEGAWVGIWLSHSNGHTGKLRAIVKRDMTGAYETRFHATFWKLFSAGYTVTLRVKPDRDVIRLVGHEDLGSYLGCELGEYTYEGRATSTEFKCTYQSEKDRGVFEMTRPK